MYSDLWKSEKRRLSDFLYQRAVRGRESVPLEELLEGVYPEFFLATLKVRARRIVENDLSVQVHTPSRYRLDLAQIEEGFAESRAALLQHLLFSAEEVQAVVEFSVAFQYDVLVRPRQTLDEILYGNDEPRKREDVLVILAGFGEDRPFIKKMQTTLEQLQLETITRDRYDVIARAIEKEVYEQKPISAFMTDVQALLAFESAAKGEEVHELGSEVLLGMLWERQLRNMAGELREEAGEKASWSLTEVESALERSLLIGGFEPSESDDDSTPGTELPDSRDARERAHAGRNHTPKLKIQFAEEAESLSSRPPASPDQAESPFRPVIVNTEEEKIIVSREKIERQPPGPYPALYTLINPRDRKVFIKKIFGRDQEQYQEFIERLEKLDRWKDAKALIDDELRHRRINPFSKEAVLLGDVVFSRYFRK